LVPQSAGMCVSPSSAAPHKGASALVDPPPPLDVPVPDKLITFGEFVAVLVTVTLPMKLLLTLGVNAIVKFAL
jgi:hypothetical protein